MKAQYLRMIMEIQKLSGGFLRLLESQLQQKGFPDINGNQALILYHIRNDSISVTDIMNKGYYLKSNVSYNLEKMIKNGYIIQEVSSYDKRSFLIRLSKKGLDLHKKMDHIINSQLEFFEKEKISELDLKNTLNALFSIEKIWSL